VNTSMNSPYPKQIIKIISTICIILYLQMATWSLSGLRFSSLNLLFFIFAYKNMTTFHIKECSKSKIFFKY